MADQENNPDLKFLKRTKISVLVDEALPDILVVTYEYGLKIFKGVLLDATKRNLPFGIQALNPAFTAPKKTKPEDDPLYSVNQRYAYSDPNLTKGKNVQIPSKYKNNKMTVRLRPRQVLCSKCKGICNENSENVSRKRKSSESVHRSPPPPLKRGLNAPVTRSVYTELNNKKNLRNKGATLVPKLTRLTAEEEHRALTGTYSKMPIIPKKPLTTVSNLNDENTQQATSKHSSDHSEDSSNSEVDDISDTDMKVKQLHKIARKQLKKKRSTESSDDETSRESNKNNNSNVQNDANQEQLMTNTRTIKISYGPQGEGTVLKIPAKLDRLDAEKINDDSEENVNIIGSKMKVVQTKAARKALKKAKKEARKKVLVSGSSPCYIGSGSPRCIVGGSSPRYTVGSASPRHGLGNNSPRYMCASFEINPPRRRKHKMKHKKKHKDEKDRKHKEGEVSSSTQEDLKDQCSTHKLSINLRRLSNKYAPCTLTDNIEEDSSSSDEQNEQVPDFPPPNQPFILHINAQTVSSASGADGVRLLVGDVVWGKVHGFPWWPGKILTITNCNNRDFQAHVSWYGSSTTSLMQCDQLSPYLEHFKIRFNKKKRGPYKDAIKQATTEARENAENRLRQPLGNSPSHNIITQVVPPALASPREIDVVS